LAAPVTDAPALGVYRLAIVGPRATETK